MIVGKVVSKDKLYFINYLYYTWFIFEVQGIMEDLKVRNEINKRLLQKTILEEYPVYMQMDLLNFLEKDVV